MYQFNLALHFPDVHSPRYIYLVSSAYYTSIYQIFMDKIPLTIGKPHIYLSLDTKGISSLYAFTVVGTFNVQVDLALRLSILFLNTYVFLTLFKNW